MDDRSVVVRIPRRWIRIALIVAVTTAVVAPLTAVATHSFDDVPGSNTFHDDIDWLKDAGVTLGCNPPANDRYCPDDVVTRAQMSAFMRRLAENQVVDPIPLTAGDGIVVDGRNVSVDLTAGDGIAVDGGNVSVDTPLKLTDSVSGANDEDASVVSAINLQDVGGGTFGLYGESNRGSAVGPGAGVKGRGNSGAYGVLGEAGDLTNIPQPIGEVGVVGRGQNRGTYGSSQVGIGVYGVSSSNYGVWGQSTTWRGVTGRTGLANNNWGIYTPDNSFSLNFQMAGAMMVVVQSGDDTTLQKGDVVSFSGMSPAIDGLDTVVAQVERATDPSGSVAGVVFSRFNIDAAIEVEDDEAQAQAAIEATPSGPVQPGEYLLLVIFGPAQVRADSGGSDIDPGDSLGLAGTGQATSDEWLTESQGAVGQLGAVGTALESLGTDSEDLIWVYVGAD